MRICFQKDGVSISKTHRHTLRGPPSHFVVLGDVMTPWTHPQVTEDSAAQSHSNLYPLTLSRVCGLNSDMTRPESSSSLTTQAVSVAFLYLLVSITSLSFISFISYSYHHSLQVSCLFIHLKIVCTPPIQNEAPWGRDPALLTGQKEGYSQHQNRTHWI